MKNVSIPLDIIFIGDDMKVKTIKRGVPFSLFHIYPETKIKHVIEVNQGWCAANGIVVGSEVKLFKT